MTRGEEKQGAGRWAVWERYEHLQSQVVDICPMRSKHKARYKNGN